MCPRRHDLAAEPTLLLSAEPNSVMRGIRFGMQQTEARSREQMTRTFCDDPESWVVLCTDLPELGADGGRRDHLLPKGLRRTEGALCKARLGIGSARAL